MLKIKNGVAKEQAMGILTDIWDSADYITLIAKSAVVTGEARADIREAITDNNSKIRELCSQLQELIDKYAE